MKCSTCGYLNDIDAEFCENCGSLLLQFCPKCNTPIKPGASFCKKCGTPLTITASEPLKRIDDKKAQPHTTSDKKEEFPVSAAQLEGKRKPTTIMFIDIVGSTALAEKLDPEEWKEVVSGAHRRIIQVVHEYEGTIAQLLGDGVLTFFGAPMTHEDDPVRAVRAALNIQQEIGRYAFELRGYIDNFQVRVGVNTGTVVVGNVGTEMHMEYLAIGDAVNLAARIESAAEPGMILISESTARLVKSTFVLNPMREITVKGKAEPVRVCEVLELKAIPGHERGFADLESPLIGRVNELSVLNTALDELCKGHGQIVTILGEAGIGKSRLVEEARAVPHTMIWEAKPEGSGKLKWIEGRGLSYGATLSFWMISQLIKNDLGLSDGDPEPRIRASLWRRISNLFGDQVDQVLPYLARLLGVKLDGKLAEQVSILDSETLKRQTLISVTQYFEKLAASQPTVAVFEDLHWADPSSLEALDQLLSVTDRVPLMLLLLSRLEREHASWRIKLKAETDFAHRYTEIQLKPLTSSQQNQLVDNLLKIADLTSGLREQIQEHAEGNPFYLEEIVRDLIERGAIVRSGDHWQATREITDVTIPDTLQGVLLARLDRLEEDVRQTLQLASVVGRSFLYSILEVIGGAEQQLNQHLAQLQRVDLVREKARIPELEYMFKHSLTQEAAYSSLIATRRSEFHRKVGEALEKLFSDRLEEFYGILAHHFEVAGDDQKASDYLIRAGDQARLMAELTEAIGYYQRSIPLLERLHDIQRLAQVWLKLGLVYLTDFQFEEAHRANEQAFELQKQVAATQKIQTAMEPAILRICTAGSHVTLDPRDGSWQLDYLVLSNLFAGLVQIDTELNVIPDVARSWQVLDSGRRYLFFLRDDVRWSDGIPVTAHDFEYAWKRNLNPVVSPENITAEILFDVAGAQDFHEGRNPDPDRVGVRAVDNFTLEVCLQEPVAYFPYVLSMPVTYPLPRQAIERYGEDWWQTGKMVSNGPYQLVNFELKHGSIIERNPYYYGDFQGNCERVEVILSRDPSHNSSMYQANSVDMVFQVSHENHPEIKDAEKHALHQPRIDFIQFALNMAPLDDLRVRKALALALDRNELSRKFDIKPVSGGFIPPGIPGHSPDIGIGYDPQSARQLLAEAGYRDGKGLPVLKGLIRTYQDQIGAEISQQWRQNLGIEANFEPKTAYELAVLRAEEAPYYLICMGWTLDYPDPENLLNNPNAFLDVARVWGWHNPVYDRLVKEAGRTPNQRGRMEMYRQADRILVQEQVVLIPISYGSQNAMPVKPWVKNLSITPIGRMLCKDIIIEAH